MIIFTPNYLLGNDQVIYIRLTQRGVSKSLRESSYTLLISQTLHQEKANLNYSKNIY